MGGFQVYHPNGVTRPFTLHPDDVGPCLKNGDITISEQDILDKSKGDLLAKSIVLLQLFWFALQVLARASQDLVITQLEIVTLAFATLNFYTYLNWWNKPLDVNLPIQITADHIRPRRDPDDHMTASTSSASDSISVAETTLTVGSERNVPSQGLFQSTRQSIDHSDAANASSPTTSRHHRSTARWDQDTHSTITPLPAAVTSPGTSDEDIENSEGGARLRLPRISGVTVLPLSVLRSPEKAVVRKRPGAGHSSRCGVAEGRATHPVHFAWASRAGKLTKQCMLQILWIFQGAFSITVKLFDPYKGSAQRNIQSKDGLLLLLFREFKPSPVPRG
ncbi:hypothetical protein DXG01_000418 [Tephrocybe rancida]|nr:hypothetical protein DXG01_000418 [Tephrocybe rancida]